MLVVEEKNEKDKEENINFLFSLVVHEKLMEKKLNY